MLLMLVMLVGAVALVALVVLLILGGRQRQHRRVSRARRHGDYAERHSTWSTYVNINRWRRTPRITDQRQADD